MKTKWLFYAKGQKYQTANFSKFCEWLNNVEFVHDELLVQFRQSSDKKQSTSIDRTKTTGSSMSATANDTGCSTFNSNPKAPTKCVVCANSHGLWACDAFKKLSPIDRYKKVKENTLCFLCFRGGHAVKACKMKECGIDGCKRRHNRLLHRAEETKSSNTTSMETVETHASVSLNTFGILPVYEVNLSNSGKNKKLLALVDSGSSLSWIDKTSADLLALQGVKRGLTVSGINGTECHDSELVKVTIHSKDYGNEDIQMAIHQNLVIGDSFYNIQRMQNQYPQLNNVPSNNFKLEDVKVILGTDCFSLTRLLEYQRGQPGEPWAVRRSLGWTVSGPLPKKILSSLPSCHSSVHQSADFDLNEQIKTWWVNESYGSRVKVNGRSRSDVKALETLEKTTRCENDRYTVECCRVFPVPVCRTTIGVPSSSSCHSKIDWPRTQNSKLRVLIQSGRIKMRVILGHLNQLNVWRLEMKLSGIYPITR